MNLFRHGAVRSLAWLGLSLGFCIVSKKHDQRIHSFFWMPVDNLDVQRPVDARRFCYRLRHLQMRNDTLCKTARLPLQNTVYAAGSRDDKYEVASRADCEIASVAGAHGVSYGLAAGIGRSLLGGFRRRCREIL